jgi:hypothetical protein
VSEAATGKKLVLTEEQALELITFLVSSAEICLHEPIYYGTFRLIDGASRLMGLMLENDPETSGEFLKNYKDEIDANKTQMMWDRESYYEFLRHIPAKAAAELKRVRELADSEGSAS